MSAVKLLTCPFCGGRPYLKKGKKYTSDGAKAKFIQPHRPGDWIWRPQIGCKQCNFASVGESVEQLVEWWNQRKPF